MEMKKQRWSEAEPCAQDRPRKRREQRRLLHIINLRIERKQRSAVKQKQREAQEEEHPFKIPLPTVAKYYYHPEQHQQRPRRVADQPNIEKRTHSEPRADSTLAGKARQSPSARFFLHQLRLCK